MRAAAVRDCHAAAFLMISSCTASELGPTCFAICPSDSARFSSHRRSVRWNVQVEVFRWRAGERRTHCTESARLARKSHVSSAL